MTSDDHHQGGDQSEPAATVEIRGEALVIELPLARIKAIAEGGHSSAFQVTDARAFAEYLARALLRPPPHNDADVFAALDSAIHAICDDAVYVGAGIRSRLEDIPHLVDRMWRCHEKVLGTSNGYPAGKTVHECLVEAIAAAMAGDTQRAAGWLSYGQHLNEPVRDALKGNLDEALEYAIKTYVGVPVPEQPGFVRSPHSRDKITDVQGYARGTEVKDPYTGKIFLVP